MRSSNHNGATRSNPDAKPATLHIRPMPHLGERIRQVVLDCDHGTTTLYQFDTARSRTPDASIVMLALTEHDAAEHCGCTAALWQRYILGAGR